MVGYYNLSCCLRDFRKPAANVFYSFLDYARFSFKNAVFIVKPENTCTLYKTQNLTSLARFPNLATLQRVNLIVGFTIMHSWIRFRFNRSLNTGCLY